jgi:hypothetical protein
MGRPPGYQWEPLGLDTDPVPGDPQVISEEARHLAEVASQLEGQVAALRRIAGGSENIGKTADKVRSAASDLVGDLSVVATRYQKVSSALNGWVPELEQAQTWSIQALNQAEAPYAKMKNTPQPAGVNVTTGMDGLPQVDPLTAGSMTAAQKQEFSDYRAAMSRAQGELADAQALLNKATSLRDSKGSYYAGQINGASNDSLKDSWWDKFKNFVDKWAWLIKDICTGLEILATILAVLALIFTGVGWIVILGLALTAVALIGRTMLAATGNGSWFDVALDAFALLTFGAGTALTKLLGKATDSVVELAKGIEAAKTSELLDNFANLVGEEARQSVWTKFLAKAVPVVEDSAKTTLWERLGAAGDGGVVNMMKTVTGLVAKFTGNAAIGTLGGQAQMIENLLRVNFAATNVAGFGGLAGAGIEFDGPNAPTPVNWHIPGVGDWFTHTFEEPTTMDGGLSTSAANNIVNVTTVVAPEIGIPVQGFRWALSNL